MSDGLTFSRPRSEGVRLNRKMFIVLMSVIGVGLTVAIFMGTTPNQRAVASNENRKVQPASKLDRLPTSYDELPIPTPAPRTVVVPPKKELSEIEKLKAQLVIEQFRKQIDARKAGVTFASFDGTLGGGISTLKDEALGKAGSIGTDKLGLTSPSKASALKNARDDDNRQDDKREFLESERDDESVLNASLQPHLSEYGVLAGTIIPGVLITTLNSDLPGQVIGQVSENVFDTRRGRHLLIPQGTKLLGHYDSRISYGQERLLLVWSRLIFPNGKSITLKNMPGIDGSGAAGVTGDVDNHLDRLITGIVLSSVLGAAAQMADGSTFNTFNPSYDQLALQGLARNANDVGQQITQRNLNIQPTIVVEKGSRFNVLVNKDFKLEPYIED